MLGFLFFCTACLLAGCTKNCTTNYRTFRSYLQIIPDKDIYKIGDTLKWRVIVPFVNFDSRTNEQLNISNTTSISKLFLSVVRVDKEESPGIYAGGLKSFSIIIEKANNVHFSQLPGYKDARIDFNFIKSNDGFEALFTAIAKEKGVFMISHTPASGEDKCMIHDFSPVLYNNSRNEDLYYKYAIYNNPVNFFGSEFFFKID